MTPENFRADVEAFLELIPSFPEFSRTMPRRKPRVAAPGFALRQRKGRAQ